MHNRLYFISLVLIIVFGSCQKEEKKGRDYPQIRTIAVDQITSQGARFNAIIISGSRESISEYGFLWGETEYLATNNSQKVLIQDAPEKDQFSDNITFALEEMKEYYVRSYVISEGLIIYGDPVKFMSLGSMAPEITDFEPQTASWTDTVKINGKNFSPVLLSNSVHIGNAVASVISATRETLIVKVPSDLTSVFSKISVEIVGNLGTSSKLFELITPGQINTVNKKNITWGDTLVLTGRFPYRSQISMDLIPTNILERNESKIKIVVPSNLKYYDSITVDLNIDGHLIQSVEKNHMILPVITSVGDSPFGWGDTIDIKGVFNPVKMANTVKFSSGQNTQNSAILDVRRDRIRCIVPDYPLGHQAALHILTDGYYLSYSDSLGLSGPVIEKIAPNKAGKDAPISIKGKYFRNGITFLKIGNVPVYCGSNSRLIQFNMPDFPESGYKSINVRVYNKETTQENAIYFSKAAISDFNPKEGTFGDIITVTGEGFDPNNLTVAFENNGIQFEAIEKSSTLVKFAIPNTGARSPCKIYINTKGSTFGSLENLQILPPRLDEITPSEGLPGEVIRIYGDYFNPENIYNKVHIGDQIINCNSSSRSYVEFNFPVSFLRGDYPIQVENGSDLSSPIESFHCKIPWRIEKPAIGNIREFSSSFFYNGGIWLVGGLWSWQWTNDVYVYSLITKNMAHFSAGIYTSSTFSFEINGQGYFGLGLLFDGNEHYYPGVKQIDLTNRTITNLQNFPGSMRKYSFSFSLLSKGYVGSGKYENGLLNDFWKFDPGTGTWNQLTDLPFGSLAGATAITMNDYAYVISGNNFWKYDPNLNSWVQMADFPGPARYHGTGFSIGDNLYFGTGRSNMEITGNDAYYRDLWKYNSLIDSWIRMRDLPVSVKNGAYGFSYDGKGYIGGGGSSEADLLEYDPSYE